MKGGTMTPTTVAESENPARTAVAGGDGSRPHRKAVISPVTVTLTAIVVGVALITLGTTWARQPGTNDRLSPGKAAIEIVAADETSELDTAGNEPQAVASIADETITLPTSQRSRPTLSTRSSPST
jgi:hypothetical protein